MKTALLIPGLDAFMAAARLNRWLDEPDVSSALREASGYLARESGIAEDLAAHLKSHARPHVADFERTLVCITAIQVGVARALSRVRRWDLVVGCSHGDIARSVVVDSISFASAVEILWMFGRLRSKCPSGRTANLRTVDRSALTAGQLAWLRSREAALSLWSPTHGTLSGSAAEIEALSREGRAHGLKIKPLLAYPIHSPIMMPMAATMMEHAPRWPVKPPSVPVFSSVFARYVDDADQVVAEAIAGATQPLVWIETVDLLVRREQVDAFLNVGPSTTLADWLPAAVTVEQGWDVLRPRVAAP